jgi:hypothetical protein
MDLGLPENIIKVGGVREHGRRIKVGWEGECRGRMVLQNCLGE